MSQATMPEASQTTPEKKPEKKPERGANGRFVGGNKGGPGNPFGRRMAAMREAIQRAISVEDIEAIMAMLREKSRAGDLAATRLLLQYAVGKPKPVVEPDRVELEAWENAEESWVEATRCTNAFQGVPVGLANVMMGAMSEAKTNQLGEALVNPAAAEELAKAAARDDEDDDDQPLTPEEIAEAKRDWVEANARYAEMVAAQDAADAAAGVVARSPDCATSVDRRSPERGKGKETFGRESGTVGRPCHSAAAQDAFDAANRPSPTETNGAARTPAAPSSRGARTLDRPSPTATNGARSVHVSRSEEAGETEHPRCRTCVGAIASDERTRNVNGAAD